MSNEPQIKEFKVNELIFSLNEVEKTAEIIGFQSKLSNNLIFIPRSITYNSQEFIVTSIKENSFKHLFINSIEFPEESEVCKIENKAFQYCNINSISIPASIIDLEEGWNANSSRLLNITINCNNKRYKKVDNLILGKSDIKSDIFDILIFVPRDIKTVTIPPTITRISSYSLSYTIIEKITFPSSVVSIGEYAFFNCIKLKQIEFPKDSNLKIIESKALYLLPVESLNFPAKLSELENGWCTMVKKLEKVTVDPDNKKYKNDENDEKLIIGKTDDFNVLVFAARDIKTTTIPPNITHISSFSFNFSSIECIVIPPSVKVIDEFAFSECFKLTQVEIPHDSQLETIGKGAFYFTKIKKIFIPRNVSHICEKVFSSCKQLEEIEFANDSNLQTIDSLAFFYKSIDNLSIPSSVSELKDGWCCSMGNLKKVIISNGNKNYKNYENLILGKSNNESDNFDVLVFASRDIKWTNIPANITQVSSYSFYSSTIVSIIIPPSVTHISECSFYVCKKLTKVKIPRNSQLVEIGSDAFYYTSIGNIFIPPQIVKINSGTFNLCKYLLNVEITNDSQLETIDEDAFAHSAISCFYIPPHLKEIHENAFYECYNLKIIEVDEQSPISIESLKYTYCNLIMVPYNLTKNKSHIKKTPKC